MHGNRIYETFFALFIRNICVELMDVFQYSCGGDLHILFFLPQGQNEVLGVVSCTPDVKLNSNSDKSCLEWYEIKRYGQYAGDLLASFELLLVSHKTSLCRI